MKAVPVYAKGVVAAFSQVSPEDYEKAAARRWHLCSGYARTKQNGKMEYLHRYLLGLTPGDGFEADHQNGDRLDNRRENLRVVTTAENRQNTPAVGGTSKHRGVYFRRDTKKWLAKVSTGGKQISRTFDTEEEAAEAAPRLRAEYLPYSVER